MCKRTQIWWPRWFNGHLTRTLSTLSAAALRSSVWRDICHSSSLRIESCSFSDIKRMLSRWETASQRCICSENPSVGVSKSVENLQHTGKGDHDAWSPFLHSFDILKSKYIQHCCVLFGRSALCESRILSYSCRALGSLSFHSSCIWDADLKRLSRSPKLLCTDVIWIFRWTGPWLEDADFITFLICPCDLQ